MPPIALESSSPSTAALHWWRDVFWRKIGCWQVLYLLMLPTIASMLVFDYYPKLDVILMSFYRWQPPDIQDYHGLKNYEDALTDPLFWQSFRLIGILLAANILKLIPGILVAIALHRLLSDRWRYIYQVLFVIPMVIPGMVWLLIWKSFYDPDFGLLNRVLQATGMMKLLHWLDGTKESPGVLPRVADWVEPFQQQVIQPLFGNWGGFFLAGAILLALRSLQVPERARRTRIYAAVTGLALLLPLGITISHWDGLTACFVSLAGWVGGCRFLSRQLDRWIHWPVLVLAGWLVFAHTRDFFRLPLMLLFAFSVMEWLTLCKSREPREQILAWGGWLHLGAAVLLFLGTQLWPEPTGQFREGTPAWLGSKDLVIPAILFWGFPWVGTVGVLIYLSGLQQISQDVYEAAELDGVGPLGMLLRIELPLIMTQVRINLIFMTIGTLTGYEMFLILLGSDGGPGNKGMVPGLFMFKKAFEEGQFGYACALGMILFVIILGLTMFYNRYVKVEK